MATAPKGNFTRKEFLKANQKSSPLKDAIYMFCQNKLAVLGFILLAILFLLALFADVIADYDTKVILIDPVNRLKPPSTEHLFGTDELGRDVFARVIHGARISMKIGFLGISLSALVGTVLGAIAGYYGGLVDTLLMRATDIFTCLPDMLLAIAIVAAFGNTEANLIIAIGLSRAPRFARTIRSSVISVASSEYVEAAKAIGATDGIIIFKHVMRNCIATLIVQYTVGIASAISCISSLSFIGLGISAPAPEWGTMLAGSRAFMRDYPNLVIAPGMAIFVSLFSLNMVGDGLRDALDPKLRK